MGKKNTRWSLLKTITTTRFMDQIIITRMITIIITIMMRPMVTAMDTVMRVTNTGADRKSTRLNSSHLVISYAVFCLKKKKTPFTKSSVNLPTITHKTTYTALYVLLY